MLNSKPITTRRPVALEWLAHIRRKILRNWSLPASIDVALQKRRKAWRQLAESEAVRHGGADTAHVT